jgi:hypothetical protein
MKKFDWLDDGKKMHVENCFGKKKALKAKNHMEE